MIDARTGVPLFAVGGLTVAVGGAIVVGSRALGPGSGLIASLALLITGVAFYPLGRRLLAGRSFDPFEARHVFCLYVFFQFGFHTFVLLLRGEGFLIGDVQRASGQIVLALVYALVGLASFQVGYGVSPVKLAAWLPVSGWTGDRFVVRLGVVATYALALIAFLYLVEQEGGLLYYFTHIVEIRETRLLGRGMFYYLTSTASVAWLISAARAIKADGKIPFSQMVLLFLFTVGYLGMGFRLMAIFMVLQYLLLRHYLVRPFRLRFRYVPVVAAALLFMNLYQVYRGISPSSPGETLTELRERLQNPRVREELWTGVFERFQGTDSMVRILEISERVGLDFGRTLARDLLIAPIPRLFWPRKPEPAALELWNRVYFYGALQEGLPGVARVPTLIGELYVYGHLAGVLMGMFVMGIAARLAYGYLHADSSGSAIMMYAVFFCFVFSVNETLQTHFVLLIVRGATLAGVLTFIRLFSLARRQHAGEPA